MKYSFVKSLVLMGMLVLSASVSADVIHNEADDGDLSGVFGSPTLLDVVLGENTVIGQIGENGNTGATDGSDADYFTFDIAAGEQLTSINIDSRTPGGASFFGYRVGSFFEGQDAGDIDGNVIFSNTSGEVLDDLTGSFDPLGPGSYAFWVQEISPPVIDYSITFTVASSVPEPSSMILGAMVCCGLLTRRRRS